MRWYREDRGTSAAEAGLLMAAVAVVVIPVAFLIGHAIQDVFGDTCKAVPGSSCSQGSGGGGGGATYSGSIQVVSTAAEATQQLEGGVADVLAGVDPPRGRPTVSCDQLAHVPPAAGTTTRCTAKYPDGRQTTVTVTWVNGTDYEFRA